MLVHQALGQAVFVAWWNAGFQLGAHRASSASDEARLKINGISLENESISLIVEGIMMSHRARITLVNMRV